MLYKACKRIWKSSSLTQRLPSRTWGPIRPRVCSWFRAPIRHECQKAGGCPRLRSPVYVTAKKPNFHVRFRAYNGKNRNMPAKRMWVDATFSSYIFNCRDLVRPQIYQFWYLSDGHFGRGEKRPFEQCSPRPAFSISTSPGLAFSHFFLNGKDNRMSGNF